MSPRAVGGPLWPPTPAPPTPDPAPEPEAGPGPAQPPPADTTPTDETPAATASPAGTLLPAAGEEGAHALAALRVQLSQQEA